MQHRANVGVWGLGVHLPPEVRGNDWWPSEIVADWRARQSRRLSSLGSTAALPAGAQRVADAAARYADDPFEGGRERRVIGDEVRPSDMGIAAAKDALERAGLAAGEIVFLLVQSMVPDYHNTPDGCRIHHELGLPARCFTTTVDASCAGFVQQLTLGQAMIQSGLGRRGLLVQISPMTRILHPRDPWSATFGDAATAAVIGPVAEGRGIQSQAHCTDGRFHGGLVTGVPGARWHDEGAAYMYVEGHEEARGMVMTIPDTIKALSEDALAAVGATPADVDFLAAHQATIWFGDVLQEHMGMLRARRVNTYPWTTSVAGCNLPLVLATAERDGQIRDGDLTVMCSGATGMTVGAIVCRWGR
jgi:3-oxoacyl-[acyl-carrier-protein] synthase-3